MATFNAAAGAATLQINADVAAVSGNSSLVSWSLWLYCYNGQSFHLNNTIGWSTSIAGNGYSGTFNFDFRSTSSKLIASGSTWVGHDANGYAQIYVSGFKGVDGAGAVADNVSVGGYVDLPRIPKPPAVNGSPVASNLTPTSATMTWPANTNNNGAAIDQYLLRINKVAPADTVPYTDYPLGPSTFSHTVTDLIPGTQYYATVYAHNSAGYSGKATDTAFKTLSGAYVRRGSEWRPTEVLVRKGGQWVSGEVYTCKGGVWKPAS
ncbi:fibronectin type III domain-containing protein [Microbacterium sp. LWH10-1.2]|uniref:fibronectin type III domain-containing protein n=1 Tax=Microbacterium sp. LWH10-1.2 TaxID=3135255 RepID=UPI0031397EFE